MASGDKSIPSSFQRSAFTSLLIRWNGLEAAGFAAWEFLPGMKFAERSAWWRDGTERTGAHEGLDICFYRTGDGRRLSLGAGARVPVMCPGEVVAIVDDFLGRSVFVAHGIADGGGRRLHSVCGHVDPCPGLAPGSLLGDGDLVGTIADPSARRSPVPPHLHLSLALIAGSGPLGWPELRDPARALLLDPLPVVCGLCDPFQVSSPRGMRAAGAVR
jgi:hypothetical protein